MFSFILAGGIFADPAQEGFGSACGCGSRSDVAFSTWNRRRARSLSRCEARGARCPAYKTD
jgi:hypothetical protein